MKYLLLALLFINSTAFAMFKSLPLGKTAIINYEVPDDWDVARKEASIDAPAKMLRIKKDKNVVILALFMEITKDNPVYIKTGSMDEYIKYYHKIATEKYMQSSVEGEDNPQPINLKDLSGLKSSFTENSKKTKFKSIAAADDDFNHAVVTTYLIGDKEKGIVVSMAYLSKETSSLEYNLGLKVLDSFSLEATPVQAQQLPDYITPSVTPIYFLGCAANSTSYLAVLAKIAGEDKIEPSDQSQLAANFVKIAKLLNKGVELKDTFTLIFAKETEMNDQLIRSQGMGKYVEKYIFKESECRNFVKDHQNELLAQVK